MFRYEFAQRLCPQGTLPVSPLLALQGYRNNLEHVFVGHNRVSERSTFVQQIFHEAIGFLDLIRADSSSLKQAHLLSGQTPDEGAVDIDTPLTLPVVVPQRPGVRLLGITRGCKLFGREDDIVTLVQAMHTRSARIVLKGPPGYGKTALAEEVMADLAKDELFKFTDFWRVCGASEEGTH